MHCTDEQTAALFCSMPSVGAWSAEPLSSIEIDAEPNADRIWATIQRLEDAADEREQDALEHAHKEFETETDDSYDQGEKSGRIEMLSEIESVLSNLTPPGDVDFLKLGDWADIVKHVLGALPNE